MGLKILTIFFLLQTICYSQIVAVSADNNNFLYRGIDNPLTIAVSGIKSDKIFVKSDNGTITGEKGKYIVNPGEGNGLWITVYTIKKFDTILVGQNGFRVKKIPDPTIYIAGKTGTAYINKGELIAARGLMAKLNNFDLDISIKVKSFEVYLLKDSANVILKSFDNRFTDDMIKLFKDAQKDSIIIFQNIVVAYPDGPDRQVEDKVIITIK